MGGEDLPVERQLAFVKGLLAPLVQQVEANIGAASQGGGAEAQMVQHALVAISHLSKVTCSFPPRKEHVSLEGTGERSPRGLTRPPGAAARMPLQGFTHHMATVARPGLGELLLRVLEAALRVPVAAPHNKALRARVVALVHRDIEVLGSALLPYVTRALEVLLHEGMDAQDTGDLLGLMVQLVCRLKVRLAFASPLLPRQRGARCPWLFRARLSASRFSQTRAGCQSPVP